MPVINVILPQGLSYVNNAYTVLFGFKTLLDPSTLGAIFRGPLVSRVVQASAPRLTA